MTRAARLLLTLSALALSSPALSSVAAAQAASGPAAARLPNTFDRPQAAATQAGAGQAAPTVLATPEAEPTPAERARAEAAEIKLRATIAAMQAGAPNYDDMSPDLAAKVREQSAAITPLIKSFGALQSLAHVGVENGAELFLVGFDNQITQWIIAQNAEGRIVALLFRPAPPPPAGG